MFHAKSMFKNYDVVFNVLIKFNREMFHNSVPTNSALLIIQYPLPNH